jgi:hypothetical protein
MKLTFLALASALALSAAGVSLAQPAPGPGYPSPASGAQPWRGGEGHRPDPAQMAERHAQRLRVILQLRPDQEPALNALMAAMQPAPGERERRMAERQQHETLTIPQKLDRMQARMTERQAAFARRADAIKRFYAQLSPSQQRAFDALHAGMGHGMHGHGHEGEGPGKPHPMN